ncbi:MAG: protease, partial [Akkermansiaceae bacterium]|nr:protease [Akkermansiaceae bacterium]
MQVSRLALLLAALGSTAHAAPGFFRSPALSGDTLVFTAEGDLWKVSIHGGEARRLTSHPGLESAATISPDGKTLAFAGQYEGPTEVYVMPVEGGLPQRLTWHGEGAIPVGWTPDGKVLCSTRAYSTLPNTQLVALDPNGKGATVLPLAQASDGAMDDSGKSLFFTRLPFQGSNTKRYEGGTAQNLWRYDEGAAEAVALTPGYPGTSKNPMWWQGRLYFISDRSGVSNLWSMKPDGSDLQALTKSTVFDVRTARMDKGRIVYQQAGAIHLLDTKDGSDREVPVTLSSDFDQTRERWVTKPLEYLTSARLSPDGERLVLTARGGIFVAPVKAGGRFVELPRKSGVRYREASFFPDGKTLLAQSDESGEIEMVRLPANGVGASEALTSDSKVFPLAPVMSPDGKWVAWQDKNLQLWMRDLTAKKTVLVRTSTFRPFDDLAWSPDSAWLAFVETSTNTNRAIRLYNVASATFVEATSDRTASFSPSWSPDGKWLYFLSDRTLRTAVKSPWGPRQPEPFFTESTRIYALALQKNARSPFDAPDELHPAPVKEEKDKDKKEGGAAAEKGLPALDADGLAARLFEVPGVVGNLA